MTDSLDAAVRVAAFLSDASAFQATAAGWHVGKHGSQTRSDNAFFALGLAAGEGSAENVLDVLDRQPTGTGLTYVASMLCGSWMGAALLDDAERRRARFAGGWLVGHTDGERLLAVAKALGPFSNYVDVAAELHLRAPHTTSGQVWETLCQRPIWTDSSFANQWLRIEARRDITRAQVRLDGLEMNYGRRILTFGAVSEGPWTRTTSRRACWRYARMVPTTRPRPTFPGVLVRIDTDWLDAVRPDAPITDARLQVARVKEGLRRRRRWWVRLQTAEDWLTFDLPAIRSGTEASVPSSDLVGHGVWSWASPMMQRVLCEAQAWSAHGLDLRESPYPPLLAAIADGVWFGRDHTGGMTVGLAWFDLRDPTVFESEEPFIEA